MSVENMDKIFQDYFMQEFYNGLIKNGWKHDKAVQETVCKFEQYDKEEL